MMHFSTPVQICHRPLLYFLSSTANTCIAAATETLHTEYKTNIKKQIQNVINENVNKIYVSHLKHSMYINI
jgi:hypothetical protein